MTVRDGMKRGGRETFDLPNTTPTSGVVDLVNVSWNRPVLFRLDLIVRVLRSPQFGTGNDAPGTNYVFRYTITEGVEEAANVFVHDLVLGAFVLGRTQHHVIEGTASQVLVAAEAIQQGAVPDQGWLVEFSACVATMADATTRGEAEAVR